MPDLTCDSDFESDMEDENPSISFPAMQQYSFVFENSSGSQTLSQPKRSARSNLSEKKKSSNVETTVLDTLTQSENDIVSVQPKSSTIILTKEVNCVTFNNPSADKNFRCCDCHSSGKYIKTCSRRCPCKTSGNKCLSCFPLSKGRCTNASLDSFPHCSSDEKQNFQSAIDNIQPKAKSINSSHEMKKLSLEQNPLSFADTKMIAAFGIAMVNSQGSPRIELWDKIWKRLVIRLRGKQ